MWLGEQITERGIGNGISLIIFAGIVTDMPDAARPPVLEGAGRATSPRSTWLIIGVLIVLVVAAIIFFERGQRRIPVQYAKRVVGRKMFGGQSTHLPLKVNTAGVIPPIFASSILMFPAQIAIVRADALDAADLARRCTPGDWRYNVLYVGLIVFFCYFYTAVTFNPVDVADNMKKYGGFIPGIRPGKATAEYIDKRAHAHHLRRRALHLGRLRAARRCCTRSMKVPFYFGGTGLMIVVGVALDTVQQIESHLITRNYEGFTGPQGSAHPRPRRARTQAPMCEADCRARSSCSSGPRASGKGTQAQRLVGRFQHPADRDRRHAARGAIAVGTRRSACASQEFMRRGPAGPRRHRHRARRRSGSAQPDAGAAATCSTGFRARIAAGRGARRRCSPSCGAASSTASSCSTCPTRSWSRASPGAAPARAASATYHVELQPPKVDGRLRSLRRRAHPARRRRRGDDPRTGCEEYHAKTAPVLDYFEQHGWPLPSIDAVGDIDQVFGRIYAAVAAELGGERDVDPAQERRRDRASCARRTSIVADVLDAARGAPPSRASRTWELERDRRRAARRSTRPSRRSSATTATRRCCAPRSTRSSSTASRARTSCSRTATSSSHRLRRLQGRLVRRLGADRRRSARSRPRRAALIDATRESLETGHRAVRARATGWATSAGRSSRTSRRTGYSVVRQFVGHGIGRADARGARTVPNYGEAGKGKRLTAGLVVAIEPMVNAGTPRGCGRRRRLDGCNERW